MDKGADNAFLLGCSLLCNHIITPGRLFEPSRLKLSYFMVINNYFSRISRRLSVATNVLKLKLTYYKYEKYSLSSRGLESAA